MAPKTNAPLRQRMTEDMRARHLSVATQKGHIRSCRRFAAFLRRSPDTAVAEDVRRFQLQLSDSGISIGNRNRTMTGLKFLFRVTLRRLDLTNEIYHVREPQKIPLVISPEEAKRLLAMAKSLKVRLLLSLAYGCGLRAGEVVRLRAGDIDSALGIIRVVQAKGRKDRHVTLPAVIADIAYYNKAFVYDILFKVSAETMRTIAADPKHLGARIGVTAVLHTWGSAMTHHPHIHMIVPGGGIAIDGERWVSCRPGFFLPVRVLSRLFRRLFLEKLGAAHKAGRLQFFGEHRRLADGEAFARYVSPLRKIEWVVYAKQPFAGPDAVLTYLSRYTHRVAIANSRLVACDDNTVAFRWKDYRSHGRERWKTMTLATPEFIRRFLSHVLPTGFHRIRHYGLFANGNRAANIATARQLLGQAPPADTSEDQPTEHPDATRDSKQPCPACGGRMIIIETFEPGCPPRAPPQPAIAA
jgi:site-specific recombinase XerC